MAEQTQGAALGWVLAALAGRGMVRARKLQKNLQIIPSVVIGFKYLVRDP